MLTSLASGDEPLLAQKSGIDAFLTKPVRQQELVNVLSDLFAAAPLAAASGDGGVPAGGAAAAAAPTPAPPVASPRPPSAEVLLVEDNPVNQEVARAMLIGLGCDVAIAGNGREALEAMTRERFSLVMMDCQMPEMDGFEAVRRLRDPAQADVMQTPRDVPVVAITANALAGDAERCRAAGFSDYLAKPFKQQQLAEMVQRWARAPATRRGAGRGRGRAIADDAIAELDRETLERIRDMERRGAARLLDRLVAAYLEWAERLMGDGQRALDAGNADGLRQAVHTLKSASANLGALEFSRLCAELESMARDGRLHDARALWESARREHARVLRALRGLAGDLAERGLARDRGRQRRRGARGLRRARAPSSCCSARSSMRRRTTWTPTIALQSPPGDRGAQFHRASRKVRTPQGRELANGQALYARRKPRQGDGKWNRKRNRRLHASAAGKGEKVR